MEAIRTLFFLFMLVSFLVAFVQPGHAIAETSKQPIKIYIDDSEVSSDVPELMKNDKLYVPIRFVSEKFGSVLGWNASTNQATLDTPFGDRLLLTMNDYFMKMNGKSYFSDTSPIEKNGRTYLPLRMIAEFMHAEVSWSNADKTAVIKQVPLYTAADGDTVASVARLYGLKPQDLKEYNGFNDGALQAGSKVKVVIPSVIAERDKYESLYLLAKLVTAEAGDEPLKGQIAVGDVVMNRVSSELFPDTIHDVIYAQGQFTPAMNGDLDKIKPGNTAILAASLAFNGERVVKDALYFFNPKRSRNAYLDSLQVIANIGNHRFAK